VKIPTGIAQRARSCVAKVLISHDGVRQVSLSECHHGFADHPVLGSVVFDDVGLRMADGGADRLSPIYYEHRSSGSLWEYS
jgi:hypothetical protein